MTTLNSKKSPCDPSEVAVKSFFLGPAAENAAWLESTLGEIFQKWYTWRRQINSKDGSTISNEDQSLPEFISQQEQTSEIIRSLAKRFESEIPKFSPRYIGHMFSEVSMPALLGHFITLLHNPNNISSEASKVGTEIEFEAIGFLKELLGYKEGSGHFTSGGTVANFEFLFRARERLALWLAVGVAAGTKNPIAAAHMGWEEFERAKINVKPEEKEKFYILNRSREAFANLERATGVNIGDPVLLVPWSKHYSWPKGMHYLGMGEANIRYLELDRHGRATPESLKLEIERALKNNEPILGVVGVVGTTEMGTIDPIDKFVNILEQFRKSHGLHIWLHVDAAYGGFFRSMVNQTGENLFASESVEASLRAMEHSDSVTLDPHKLGYVPYASGAFVCRNERDHFIRSFTGPYIVSDEKTLGNYTLEGSRSAGGAVATYASIKSFDSIKGYSKIMRRTIASKNEFQSELKKLKIKIFIPESLDTNILCFVPVGNRKSLSALNEQTLEIYNRMQESKEYWISKTTLTRNAFSALMADFCSSHQIEPDSEELVLLRLTLMNPFTVSKESEVNHVAGFCAALEREFL